MLRDGIKPDHMECVTLGGLPTRLELADIKLGISVCRNPHLANIFYRLQLIEAYGTGIKKIMVDRGKIVKPGGSLSTRYRAVL